MKNRIKLIGLMLIAVIGLSFTACDDGSKDNDTDGNTDKLKNTIYYDENGFFNGYGVYEYDFNNKTKYSFYGADGFLYNYDVYEYDFKGNQTKCSSYQAENRVCYKYNGFLYNYDVYEYDSKGNRTKDSSYGVNGVYGYVENEYDSKGNKTKSSIYDANGVSHGCAIYTYNGIGVPLGYSGDFFYICQSGRFHCKHWL
jgi:hypothetical protein